MIPFLLILAVLLGGVGCTTDSEQETAPNPKVVFQTPMVKAPDGPFKSRPKTPGGMPITNRESGLEVSFLKSGVTLRSEPGLRFPIKRILNKAIGKKATLFEQNGSWGHIRLEGETYWIHSAFLDRRLKTTLPWEVLFRVSDVNLRSGPGVRFPEKRVIRKAKGKTAILLGESERWAHIVYEGYKYWVHFSLINRHPSPQNAEKSPKTANQLTYFQWLQKDAAAGDAKAMEMVGLQYGRLDKLHLEMSYMWLSLAMENANPRHKAEINKYLDEHVIPKLGDFDIYRAEKKLKRCKESNYTDCADTGLLTSFER